MTTSEEVAAVIPLPVCVERVGARCYRWWCWRCAKWAKRPVANRQSAVRQLDAHARAFHNVR